MNKIEEIFKRYSNGTVYGVEWLQKDEAMKALFKAITEDERFKDLQFVCPTSLLYIAGVNDAKEILAEILEV